ncbi:hypothetical protein AGLY_008638 [Aphis glycines]|uniref:Uncharacterized protein n=1 Tax=Aphis glycines TaxID=307491 RepID=A0A6G0TKK2_APHGL|nr:hypothetical protein AGLY_008638 [Aphis glycines]
MCAVVSNSSINCVYKIILVNKWFYNTKIGRVAKFFTSLTLINYFMSSLYVSRAEDYIIKNKELKYIVFSCISNFKALALSKWLYMDYAQSWNRSIQQNGLSNEHKDKNSDIRRWLVQCYSLSFLSPGSVSEYFVNYLMKSKPDDERLTRFADYLVDVYIIEEAQYPPEVWA